MASYCYWIKVCLLKFRCFTDNIFHAYYNTNRAHIWKIGFYYKVYRYFNHFNKKGEKMKTCIVVSGKTIRHKKIISFRTSSFGMLQMFHKMIENLLSVTTVKMFQFRFLRLLSTRINFYANCYKFIAIHSFKKGWRIWKE